MPPVPDRAAPLGPLGLERGLDLLALRLPGRPVVKGLGTDRAAPQGYRFPVIPEEVFFLNPTAVEQVLD